VITATDTIVTKKMIRQDSVLASNVLMRGMVARESSEPLREHLQSNIKKWILFVLAFF
jgi:hypothetical protein